MTAVLELSGVSRVYRNGRGLKNTSLSMSEGEIVGLLGANGSGKTTLMKIACGLTRPDTGEACVMGESVKDAPEKALASVGALIETPALYPFMSGRDNLLFASDYLGIRGKKAAMDALEKVGLIDFAKDKVKSYSLGMKQRLGLAMAFIGGKKLLLMDEPTNGLDIESAAQIKDAIKTMCCESGAAAIVSSHLAGEIERLATRIIILHDGAILKDVSISEVTKDGRTLEDYYLAIRRGEAV